MGGKSLALFYVLPCEVNFSFSFCLFVFFNVIDEGFSPTPQTSLSLSAKFFQLCFNCFL